jgi:phenylacetate-CoA ligase
MGNIVEKKIHGLLNRIQYRNYFGKYNKSQFFSKEQLAEIQKQKLKEMVSQAVSHVPFYQPFKNDIDFDNFTLNELSKLPVVNKEIIRKDGGRFINLSLYKFQVVSSYTSGSTGKPFEFRVPYFSEAMEDAMAARAWGMGRNYIYKPGDPIISLRSYAPQKGEPFLKRKRHHWYLSAFDLHRKNIDYYINAIVKSKAKVIRGYASSIYILTLLLKECNISLEQISTLVTSSESLLEQYRKTIEDYWGLKVLDWYGQNERTVTVQQCAFGNYHNNDEYGLIELGSRNEIIATSLYNYAMPFLRYDTGDIAEIKPNTEKEKCPCGRGLSIPFAGIQGRTDDILMKNDGTLVPAANIYTGMQKFDKILQFKIVQNEDLSIDLYLVVKSDIDSEYEKQIIDSVQRRVGDVKINIALVDEIERNRKTGKVKTVESKINLQR